MQTYFSSQIVSLYIFGQAALQRTAFLLLICLVRLDKTRQQFQQLFLFSRVEGCKLLVQVMFYAASFASAAFYQALGDQAIGQSVGCAMRTVLFKQR
ncbi:hypothetical protein ACO0LC_10815 [Undibacterium sp. JH2W]|uniref:hypothetical protein n=1 Tax=Undibacterium sp. JH2W TaxID=3413037 RepID=UPI003BF0D73E